MELPLLQSWLPAPEPGFLPSMARFSWADGVLRLEAKFTGHAPTSRATAHGQRLWELGDVAELFVQKVGEESYREYQVSPNGFTMALQYPDLTGVAEVRSGLRTLADFLSGEIHSVECTTTADGWSVSLEVPLPASPSERFRVSCCRYAYPMERSATISSTSLHPVRDFHRPQDWREFVPVAG
ncbi:MAG: hypothetical protein EBR40_10150 [Proteobacteria bacterium]|nr:hypothetical protein [Pseudomonadota bacterium]